MISSRSLGIPEVSAFVKTTHVREEDVGRGGVADVYPALFQPLGAPSLKIAIKTIRTESYGKPPERILEKTRRKLNRELGVWRTLQGEIGHPNLLRLLGVIDSPNGIPSSVSEFCTATLAEYLTDRERKPQRLELLIGTLRGLAYIHGFSIVHGDLKGLNILVNEAGTPKICDFGHSRFTSDPAQPITSDLSSKFHATTRYMSPELFADPKSRPTIFSDVWAFGCVALEILSQLRPYHIIKNEHRVTLAIKSGRSPSTKPEYPYAASCLSDTLWKLVVKCWDLEQHARPTAPALLSAIDELVEKGELDTSHRTPVQAAGEVGEELVEWPEGIEDLSEGLSAFERKKVSVQRLADVWVYFEGGSDVMTGRENGGNRMYAVKVLRASGGLGSRNPTLDPYQQGLRRVVRERASIEHKNIITLLGLELSYGRYPGLVMEYCAGGTLESFLDTVPADDLGIQNRCMVQILEGLQFMHTLPSPLYHGDLTPHNILVDGAGTLKLTLFSFARLTANLSAIQMTATTDEAISARYLSPELLQEENKPTTHSDMWSFGCIACWMQIRLDPYFECKLEHQVVASILDNHPPYTPTQIMGLGPRRTGGVHVMPTSPWLTNGTWALVLRCWNRDETKRPNASACVRDIAALGGVRRGETLKEAPGSVSADVVDLSGKVMTLEKVRKKILGHSVGTWRRAYNYKGSEVIDIHYWWWKGTHSPRFYLRSTEVSIKGIRLSAGVRSGDLLDSARQCIYHEIALLRQLKHENICGFLGADHTHGGTVDRPQAPAIISEFCSNGTLSEYCSRKPQELLFNDRLKLVQDVAKAIAYIHDQIPEGSIVHGGLSTESILVNKNGNVRLSGFEFACQYEHMDNPSLARIIYVPHLASSPTRWHAPELFNDSTDSVSPCPTRYSDMWAFGCVLVAVLSDQPPYESYDLPGAISCITEGMRPYTQDICSDDVWELANTLWDTPAYSRASATQAYARLSSL